MKISLITVNYNNSEDTIKLLASLKENMDQDFDIIVVDNNSRQVEVDKIRYWIEVNYPKVHLIKSAENLGFAGGNNIALDVAFKNGSEWAILINNDTWSDRDYIASIKAILGPKTGIVGLPLVEASRIAFAGKIAWLKETLEHEYQRLAWSQEKDHYAIGAHLAISADAYQKLGGLDEKYFLYFEDVDYTLTARKKNIEVSFEDGAKLHHKISSSTSALGSPLLLRYHYRNSLFFNDKFGDKLLTSIWAVYIFTKQLVKIIIGKNRPQSIAIIKGVTDYWLGRMGKIKDAT